MSNRIRGCVVVAMALAVGPGSLCAATFEDDVRPILALHCGGCHGARTQMAGLALHEIEAVLRGGANGPVVRPGKPDESILIQRVEAGAMPPGDQTKLDRAQIQILRDWIAEVSRTSAAPVEPAESRYVSSITGEDRDFWSFRRLDPSELPTAGGSGTVDALLLSKLQEKGLTFSAAASRTRLIRRASLDLIGLPPSPEEIDAFVKDSSDHAYERLLDRLLASPQFGERWGRHWLDVAGYVDTIGRDVQANGYQVGPGRWRYRDYVVAAFNSDKPYDRFLQEQIAGDELVDWRDAAEYGQDTLEKLIATGYLRTVEDPTNEDERNTKLLQFSVVDQTIEIVTSGVMGLTVGCARCHTHKFDPIPQRDYYRLMAVFAPAYNTDQWIQPQHRFLADVPLAEREAIDSHNQALDERIKPLKQRAAEIAKRGEEAYIAGHLAGRSAHEASAIAEALKTPARKRSDAQRRLLEDAELDEISTDEAVGALDEPDRAAHRELVRETEELAAQKRTYNKIEALYDNGPTPVVHVHQRGDYESLGDIVPPGGLEVLEDPEGSGLGGPAGHGRRLAFAQWLTDGKSRAGALVARVMVNRIWAHLFGEGIVTTVDNFGEMGAGPSHPELLEWLASEFQSNGWRIKPLIRMLMLSQAYRQDSARSAQHAESHSADAATIDPDNRLLWRMRTRRLESEVIRDAMLSVSGKLDLTLGGPPIPTVVKPDGMVVFDEKKMASPDARYRRSLYLVARRRFSLSMLGVFDHPVMSTNATQRTSSAVVLQSLMMLNDEEVNEQTRFFAERVRRSAGEGLGDQIGLAFKTAFGRLPAEEEVVWAEEFLGRELDRFRTLGDGNAESAKLDVLAGLCHVLLNSNEFLYVE